MTRLLLIALLGSWLPGLANAADLEKLLMPGAVVSAHADEESHCSKCHGTFRGTDQPTLCRACHEDVDADIKQKRGFHGLSPAVEGVACRECHSDHQGRNADIVGLVPSLFEHTFTDYPLKGAHTALACKSCHTPEHRFSEAPSACNDCHSDDDAHGGEMGDQCQDCHSEERWRKAKFDHEKTDFPLTGEHADVACASCHTTTKYDQTPTQCAACHALQDSHGGLFGKQCDSCHATQKWDKATFDHAKQADYALEGRHQKAACHACHTEQTRGGDVPTECARCHAGSDVHQGRFGSECASCHSPQQWSKQAFDHGRDTDFALQGAHQELQCDRCHGNRDKAAQSRQVCVDCHQATDVHGGSLGESCQRCHNQQSWSRDLRFDHDVSAFPLVGLHAIVPCAECHVDDHFGGTPQSCRGCHGPDDVHDGNFGSQCDDCHNPGGWNYWTFDHDRQTDFPLDGSHQDLRCEQCHSEPASKADSACVACHRNDDAHGGRFGSNCASCHQTTQFRDLNMGQPGRRPER